MSTRLRVANLPHGVNEAILRMAFEQGRRTVLAVEIPLDARTGKHCGFAYVDMGSEKDAQAAIRAMDGSDLDGKELRVSEVRPGAKGKRP
jgi:RNA recognition motif-containing protein